MPRGSKKGEHRGTGRAGDPLVAIGFEHQLQRVSIILIVIDDKDYREDPLPCSPRVLLDHLNPHSPDNAPSFGAPARFRYSDQHLTLDRARRPWRTQGVNRDRMLFGWISTAA